MEMKRYEKTESILEEDVSIFQLDLDGLIYEKMFIVFEKISIAQKHKSKLKMELADKKIELLLTLDFEKELGKTRSNKEERDAIIKPYIAHFEEEIQTLQEEIEFYTNKVQIINDLIKMKESELI